MTVDTSEGSLDGLAADLAAAPYEPVRFLAQGGMGEVVVVRHRELGRQLVMKLLRSNLEGQEHLAERMRAEARMLARLSHPNLVTVVDSGRTASGRPFLVTELLEGDTLSDHLVGRGGVLPVLEALDLCVQALDGLAVVHDAGFVHRDLKPANLFIVKGRGGEAPVLKILDFGIAKALSDADRKALGLIAPTADGAIMGTPSSVSPEQVQSGKIDARTDVYGLGVVLFRLLTGRPPFVGDALELFRAHIVEPAPAPSSMAPQPVPSLVDDIVLRALEKAPPKRFQSAREMREAIGRARDRLRIDADPTEVSEGEGNARTVDATGPHARGPSDDETTTQHAGGGAAPVAGAGARSTLGGTAVMSSFASMTGGAPLPPPRRAGGLAAGGTAVMDHGIAAHIASSPTPGGVAPQARAAAHGAHGFAPRPDPAPSAGPAGAHGAGVPRKTELLARAASEAPRDTVKLDDAQAEEVLWRYDPSVKPRAAMQPAAGHARAVAPPRSGTPIWVPIAAAIFASIALLVCLYVFEVV